MDRNNLPTYLDHTIQRNVPVVITNNEGKKIYAIKLDLFLFLAYSI